MGACSSAVLIKSAPMQHQGEQTWNNESWQDRRHLAGIMSCEHPFAAHGVVSGWASRDTSAGVFNGQTMDYCDESAWLPAICCFSGSSPSRVKESRRLAAYASSMFTLNEANDTVPP
ncbi:hypothetical protein FALCPG4_005159 [Fusarium falciforme]